MCELKVISSIRLPPMTVDKNLNGKDQLMNQEPDSNQPEFTGIMQGVIQVFLVVNKFRVQLDDGQVIDAFMADDLIEEVRPWYEDRTKGPERIVVTVKLNKLSMAQIIEVGGQAWCGIRRAPWR